MNIVEWMFSLLAPHLCAGCRREGWVLCPACAEQLRNEVEDRCYSCLVPSVGSLTCIICVSGGSLLERVWAFTIYRGLSKEVVAKLKYSRAKQAARDMADAIAFALPRLSSEILVVPVPTIESRVRARGYDQSVLLARRLAQQTGLQYAALLKRRTKTRQVGSNRQERFRQVEEAFAMDYKCIKKAHRKSILLVDDVLTTGATLEAAADILTKYGAGPINAAVFARAEKLPQSNQGAPVIPEPIQNKNYYHKDPSQ